MRTVKTAFFTVLFFRGGGGTKKKIYPLRNRKNEQKNQIRKRSAFSRCFRVFANGFFITFSEGYFYDGQNHS